MKRLEGQKIRAALKNMRAAGIRSFGFFILGYPGETPASLERTIDYAIDLDPDFANFYPAVPYPGTELYAKAKRDGLLASEDWTRMEYSYYLLRGNGLDEADRDGRDQPRASAGSTCGRAIWRGTPATSRRLAVDQVESSPGTSRRACCSARRSPTPPRRPPRPISARPERSRRRRRPTAAGTRARPSGRAATSRSRYRSFSCNEIAGRFAHAHLALAELAIVEPIRESRRAASASRGRCSSRQILKPPALIVHALRDRSRESGRTRTRRRESATAAARSRHAARDRAGASAASSGVLPPGT